MMLPFLAISFGFTLLSLSMVQGNPCLEIRALSGVLFDFATNRNDYSKCWTVRVPADNYVRINFTKMEFNDMPCSKAHLDVTELRGDHLGRFCAVHGIPPSVNSSDDIVITYYHDSGSERSSFYLQYHIESLNCELENHFRCSRHICINKSQVCDGVANCENGSDEVGCGTGISSIIGLDLARINSISWLKRHRLPSFGWSKNTHRAIIALYLLGGASFQGKDKEEELMVKQLELETAGALLRNSSAPLTENDLSLFINALLVTCHNPSKFHGYNLVQVLVERVVSMKPPSPFAYLTLCNANIQFSETDLQNFLSGMNQQSAHQSNSDTQAMTLMAINCIKKKVGIYYSKMDSTEVYKKILTKLLKSQQPDGSFGNIYTTSLVTQALLSSGEEKNKAWNAVNAVKYLMLKLKSPSRDFLSSSLAFPIFNVKSLVDVGNVKCSKQRTSIEGVKFSDVLDKLSDKIQVKNSLHIRDERERSNIFHKSASAGKQHSL